MLNRPESTEAVFHEQILVPPSAIDENGHVNNVVFVQWMQDLAIHHFDAVVGMDAIKASGAAWVVRSHSVEYLRPAFAGDRIEASTWVVNFSRVRSLRRYRFLRAETRELLAQGETDWVFIQAASGKPQSIPEPIRQAFVLLEQPPV